MFQKKPLLPVPRRGEEQQLCLGGAGAQAELCGMFLSYSGRLCRAGGDFLKQGVRDYRTSQQSSTGKLQAGRYEVNFDLSEVKILHILELNKWTKCFFSARRACSRLSVDPVTLFPSRSRSLLYIHLQGLDFSKSSLGLENHPAGTMVLRLFPLTSLCALL